MPGWQIQVQAWYEGGGPASGARLQVREADGRLVVEGRLDRNGLATFFHSEAKDLKIVVSVTGHRAEQTLSAEALRRRIVSTCAACVMPGPSPLLAASVLVPLPISSHEAAAGFVPAESGSEFPLWGVVGGVGVLLAVAVTFTWRSVRKAKI